MTKAILIDFDVNKNTVNLLIGPDGDPRIQTLALDKDAKITLLFGERPFTDLKLAQLAKPLQILVKTSDDKKSAQEIAIVAPTVRGQVKSVDAAGKKITVTDGRDPAKTYRVSDDAILRGIRKELAGLADVNAGAHVLLTLTPDRQRAIGVALMPVRRGDPER